MHLLRLTSPAVALALVWVSLPSQAGEVVCTASRIAQAARLLPSIPKEDVRHKALAIILLAQYGRVIPNGLSREQWDTLESIFLAENIEDALARQTAAGLPPADSIRFEGSRLDGGGFARIDNIIGTNGRPIALDRRIPARFVPLNPGEDGRLQQAASLFIQTEGTAKVRGQTNALYKARLDSHMVGDGIFIRPYAGRTDDLYYRLVQEDSGPSSELTFYAIAESLPGRRYHPLTGIGSPASVPSPWFSVSDILSSGGLLAVESYISRNPHADVRNPFFGFAPRVLHFLGPDMERIRPGDELIVSKDVIRGSIQSPHRFSPKPVQPIYSDPSRFFGCLIPKFIYVARRMTRQEMAEEIRKIDFDTPLPEFPSDPVGNEVLADPAQWTKAEFFQGLPDLLKLESAPDYNPDTDLFAGSAEPVAPPASTQTAETPPVPGIVTSAPASARALIKAPLVASTSFSIPPPLANPLVASLPSAHPGSQDHPNVPSGSPGSAPSSIESAPSTIAPNIEILATYVLPSSPPRFVSPHFASIDLSLDQILRSPALRPTPGPLTLPEIDFIPVSVANSDLFQITKAASTAASHTREVPSPVKIVRLMESDFKEPTLLVLNIPAPLLPAELPSTNTPAPTGMPAFPATSEALPLSGPLLADMSARAPSTPMTLTNLPEPMDTGRTSRDDLAAGNRSPASSPSAAHSQYLAVVTPDIAASEKYLTNIALNDSALSRNASLLSRVNFYLKWFHESRNNLISYLSATREIADATKNELQEAAISTEEEMVRLLEQRQTLTSERKELLTHRSRLRTEIEGDAIRISTSKLDAILGRPFEVSGLVAFSSPNLETIPEIVLKFSGTWPK